MILADGYGTRISEESLFRPKPMVELDDMPIFWHIMKLYSHYGFNDFIIYAGYKQHIISILRTISSTRRILHTISPAVVMR